MSGTAQAAGGSTTTTGSTGSSGTGTTGGSPSPTLAAGHLTLTIPGLFALKDGLVSVPHRQTYLHGRVTPYVAGQDVVVKFSLDGKVFKTQTLSIKRSANGKFGWFVTHYAAPKVGHVSISAQHAATAEQAAFSASRGYASLSEDVGPGSKGRFVELVQKRLANLHFYVVQSGVYDLQTELAIDAYHRLLGRGVAQTLDPTTITDLLDGIGKFHVRFPHQGRHAEGDLSDQILALISGSKVDLLFPISSGKPSTPTILGSFQVYSRVPGYLPDGMYYSDFFYRGYAIHGYDPAPDYPASHGCLRLPITDAITAYDWLALGDWVDTYYT